MKTWKKLAKEERVKVGMRRGDAHYRSKWTVGVNMIAIRLG